MVVGGVGGLGGVGSGEVWGAPKGDSEVAGLAKRLGGADEGEARAAMEEALGLVQGKDGAKVAKAVFGALEKKKRWEMVVELAEAGVVAHPANGELVSNLAARRAGALIAIAEEADAGGGDMAAAAVEAESGEGKTGAWDAALGAAGASYRVASPDATAGAVEAVGRALVGAMGGGEEGEARARRWRLEQIAGPPGEDGRGSVLSGLPVDPRASGWRAAAEEHGGEAYVERLAKVNLLLLAGDAEGAGRVVKGAYEVSPDERLAEATEAVAKTMRAVDGSVVRANLWLAALGAASPSEG